MFSFYAMNISYEILKMSWLSNELFSQYAGVANFRANMHHVFIQAQVDTKHRWSKLPYVVTPEDILVVVKQWLAKWMKDAGTRPSIPVPPVTDMGVGPSQAPQNEPLEERNEQDELEQSGDNQGGDDEGDEAE